MEQLLIQIGEHLVIVVLGVCGIVMMVLHTITSIVTNHAREKSRREIAAYVAEGSIAPEQGERLMAAEPGGEAQ